MMMTIKELIIRAHQTATEKGFWEQIYSPLHYHALIISEIAEATEEARLGTQPAYIDHNGNKPCGELIELADAMIRIADYCGKQGWDLERALDEKMKYNETRSYRHGNKKF